MGRFSSTVDFYARYREPYPATFFRTVATRLSLRGSESLLDIACGPGLLAIGFAPYVGHTIGLDPEAGMIEAATATATHAGAPVRFITSRIEEFASAEPFDIVTIGRALHWLDRDTTLPVLERIVSRSGCILICGSRSIAAWAEAYDSVRRSYESESEIMRRRRYKLDPAAWFEGSRFQRDSIVEVIESHRVSPPELVGRALSKSTTSPAMLGNRRSAFEAEIRATLEPYAGQGVLDEQISARATIFVRSA